MRHARRGVTRSAAQHSDAQHVQAAHARLRHSARTCTCAVRACVPFCLELHRTVSTRHVVAVSSPVCAYLLLRRFLVSARNPSGFRWCGASAVLADVSLCGVVLVDGRHRRAWALGGARPLRGQGRYFLLYRSLAAAEVFSDFAISLFPMMSQLLRVQESPGSFPSETICWWCCSRRWNIMLPHNEEFC